ncbi:hypothetical protein M513_11166 [Trichuris suis]|uniref:Uncharacterized protein n=1 Tax=Trichuris suis TaxID=68888 RepID=A0A085LSI7_9BILA|nr:hypothetical protein M513_11166 [Trichuris suis]
MKINPYSILPLLFVLLAASEDSSSKDQSSSEERDGFTENLATTFEDIFPSRPRPTCKKQPTESTQEKMEEAARKVFNTLLTTALEHPSEFTFGSLIVGATCGMSQQAETILHMKVKRTVTRKCPLVQTFLSPLCKSNEKRNVYCSWIGTLENGVPQKTLGAACYQSGKVSVRDEKLLGVTDVCSEWKYGDSQHHRLSIQEKMSSWNTEFLFYYPPTAIPGGHQPPADMEENVPKKFLNPEGRKGIAGKGLLKQWGKNKVDIPILLRRYNGTRQILIANGHDKGQLKGPLAMDSSSEDQSSSEERDDFMEYLVTNFEDIFPSVLRPTCEKKSTERTEENMEKAAKNVFSVLLTDLEHPSEFTFESLIVGAACGTSHRAETILHMKVKRRVTRKCSLAHTLLSPFCKSNEKRNVYCSWIGTLENEVPQKTLGAACYQSGKVSVRDEKILGVTDICSELKYGSTQLHRLLIPEQVSSWNANFFFYYPPTADPQGHQALADLGEKVPKKFLNPDGRKGIAGQGFMKKLGKNKVEIPVILRFIFCSLIHYLRHHNGTRQVLIAGRPDKWGMQGPLPMFYRKPTSSNELHEWKEPSAGEYFYSLLDSHDQARCSKEIFLKMMSPKSKIFKGHIPHPYETDNAWFTVRIHLIKAWNTSCLNELNLNVEQNYMHFHWKTYDDSTLRSVQDIVNTLFNKKHSKRITAASYRSLSKYLFFFMTATAIACVAFAAPATTIPLLILPVVILSLANVFLYIYTERWIFVREGLDHC